MKKSVVWTRVWLVLAIGFAALGLWGCPNPNSIGIQSFGNVKVVCLQASNQQPVSGALVSGPGGQTGDVTATTDSSGTATLVNVVIGSHTITANTAGLQGSNTAVVVENGTANIQILMYPTN